jgi:hypothetical protein
LIPTASRNCVVSFTGQYWQILVAEGSIITPPAELMYEDKYCSQVCDPGDLMHRSSSAAHCTGASPMAADKKLDVRYVKGLTRYIKIQNFGRFLGCTKRPANAYIMIPETFPSAEAASAVGAPAMSACASVLPKRKADQMTKETRVLLV